MRVVKNALWRGITYALILSHLTVSKPCTFSNSSGRNVSSAKTTDCAVLMGQKTTDGDESRDGVSI